MEAWESDWDESVYHRKMRTFSWIIDEEIDYRVISLVWQIIETQNEEL